MAGRRRRPSGWSPPPGLDWTIVRPPAVYGPGDSETFELFKMARRGLVALPPKGRFSVIHVEDLCRLILASARRARHLGRDLRARRRPRGRLGPSPLRPHPRAASSASAPRPSRCRSRCCRRRPGSTGWSAARNAKLTPDRVGYFCHPDWVVAAEARPPGRAWAPAIRTPTGPQGDRGLVSGAGLAAA